MVHLIAILHRTRIRGQPTTSGPRRRYKDGYKTSALRTRGAGDGNRTANEDWRRGGVIQAWMADDAEGPLET